MDVIIRAYRQGDLEQMRALWNCVVEEGNSFPQETPLTREGARAFFAEQSRTVVAEHGGVIVGLYILHPNNIGRCGHIANASYAVKPGLRGLHIGRRLVEDSLSAAARLSFKIMQFNAVVAENKNAIHLYESLGFQALGRIPGGFRVKDGSYKDILLYYIALG